MRKALATMMLIAMSVLLFMSSAAAQTKNLYVVTVSTYVPTNKQTRLVQPFSFFSKDPNERISVTECTRQMTEAATQLRRLYEKMQIVAQVYCEEH